ncbi:MAG: fumarate hydratase, partial [Treponema sp.]|nr:fumarate hydratase [Treponema sp.]
MREINVSEIIDLTARLCMDANYNLSSDISEAFERCIVEETSSIGKNVLQSLLENAEIAREEKVPMCQDTGMTVVFFELGLDVRITGGDLEEAINSGVRRGYEEGYLRKSVVFDPVDPVKRINSGDNTPAVIHYSIVSGDKIKITVTPKGFGSENMSVLKMLKPADGIEGVKNFVVSAISAAGANPCPPVIVGVGIGGTMEKCALLSKKALLRPLGSPAKSE